jgi:predicted glycosyltransferase
LKNADKIFARSGYSTIMDLFTLNCLSKAVFFPTPGQTEQIYLSEIHSTNT